MLCVAATDRGDRMRRQSGVGGAAALHLHPGTRDHRHLVAAREREFVEPLVARHDA